MYCSLSVMGFVVVRYSADEFSSEESKGEYGILTSTSSYICIIATWQDGN